ncbi:increased DNA methylation 3-like [Hibiscus syriacus]|uniref:increased DNA methylation 3-like n=1 Tax=Hibiscus syriacus TaxID=106335 RepID=UPI001924BCF0|nr:increased DNA methylation 3-like [Hibiscus syriacus]
MVAATLSGGGHHWNISKLLLCFQERERNILDVGVSQNAFLFRVALPSMRIDQSKLKCEIQRDGQGIVTQGTEVLWGLSRKCETRNETFCSPGPFTISFTLPGAVDPRLFSPTFRPDGILEVEVLRNSRPNDPADA